jgi:putative SOS response-associated peptidase YedK
MCSLFSFRKSVEEARRLFGPLQIPLFSPRDHVTPGSPIAIIRNGAKGGREFAIVRWGFVPSWSKDMQPGRPLINARSETVYEKPTFRNAIRRRRCLVPADGFYEWQGDVPGKKQAWFIHKPDGGLFAFAGIWEHWMHGNGSELESAAILTSDPHLPVSDIHDRSPVVIEPKDFDRWLSPDEEKVQDLLHAPPDDFWTMDKTTIPHKSSHRPQPPPKPQMDLL